MTKTKTLNAQHRCDRCNAQAYVLAKGLTGELLFCSHHFTKWEDGIRAFAFELVDERPVKVTVKPVTEFSEGHFDDDDDWDD